MIVCHRHRFIFLKTSKTAGTSIELALARFCGERDIITPVSPPDEQLRRELGVPGPQNWRAPLWNYGWVHWIKRIRRGRPMRRFYNHIPARKAARLLPREVWEGYFKFCVVRNPWDRFLSEYYWRCRAEPRPRLAEFLETKAPARLHRRGYGVYTIDDEVAVDRLCRYERLAEELADVMRRLDLPGPLDLPQAKSSYRTDRRSYRDVYSNAERDRIAELFADEIRITGYEY
jgi:hypothetical protein